MSNNYVIKSTELYNTGGGCMVLFMDISKQLIVNMQQPELKQLSYDGETIAALNCRYQETEEGIELENQLWIAHSWEELIEFAGIDLALEVSKRIKVYWKWTDHLDKPEAIKSIENLIDAVSAMSQLYDNWHDEYLTGNGYPFTTDFESVLIDMFNWQQVTINKLRK